MRVLTLSIAINCSSCVISNTRTNQDVNYQEHPTRIYVVANLDATGNGVTDEFYKDFSARVAACGGQTAISTPQIETQRDALSLDSTANATHNGSILADIDAFRPDAVLTMKVTNIGVDMYGQKLTAVVDSKLWDYREKKAIWAGVTNMSLGGMWASPVMRGDSLSENITGKLRSGGLIPSCRASGS